MRILLSVMLVFAANAGTGTAARAVPQRQSTLDGSARVLDSAKTAFEASPHVKAEMSNLIKAGYVQPDTMEAVIVKGTCGFVGCAYQVLVVQRYSTKGANTETASVIALVREPAAGTTPTVNLVELRERE